MNLQYIDFISFLQQLFDGDYLAAGTITAFSVERIGI
jgi:hypothetical protein